MDTSIEMTTNADGQHGDPQAMDSLSSGKLGDWVAALDLSASASQNLVELLMGDVYGATSTSDLLELEDVHIQAIKNTLPIARQNRFVRAITELREVGDLGSRPEEVAPFEINI